MTSTTDSLSLRDWGNVSSTYQHEWRVAEPREPLVLPGGVFKWYHVHREGMPVPIELDAEARVTLLEAATSGGWDLEYGLNFAMLHLSTAQAFIITGVWRGHQEMWQRNYFKELHPSGPFTRVDVTGADAPSACVWEMGVICHERMVWHRYLFSPRADADKRAWLADTYSGRV
jgi:hypothetical protein